MATTIPQLHPAMQRYLTALEARLRQTPGVAPEEGLADAHEFLQSEWETLCREGPSISDDDLYRHLLRKFGPPDDVAAAYALASEPEEGASVHVAAARTETGESIGEPTSVVPPAPRPSRVRVALAVALVSLSALIGAAVWSANLARPRMAAGWALQEKLVWAGRVVSFTPGDPKSRISNDPAAALGAPDCQDEKKDIHTYVSLGFGGELIVEFTDFLLCDGSGPDLRIVEIGPLAEPFDVAVSRDGKEWIEVGRARGAESTIDLAPFVRSSDRFRYVRLVDAKSINKAKNNWPGADIDAVGALHVVPAR